MAGKYSKGKECLLDKTLQGRSCRGGGMGGWMREGREPTTLSIFLMNIQYYVAEQTSYAWFPDLNVFNQVDLEKYIMKVLVNVGNHLPLTF